MISGHRGGQRFSNLRYRNMKQPNTATIVTTSFIALCLAMGSCASEEPLANPANDILRSYEFSIGDSQNELNFSMVNITDPVTQIDSPFDWLTISQVDNDEMGYTRISISRTKPTPEGFESGDAYLHLSGNGTVKITVVPQGDLMPSDDNSDDYKDFNKEWWKQKQILYTTTVRVNGKNVETSEYIALPWADASSSNIPDILFQGEGLSANAGWRMAYNLFTASTNGNKNSYPYFALYNKFTGTLRVFYYQKAGVGTGGELSFAVTPDTWMSPKFPFYHSLQYGIPVCNKDVPQKRNILNIVDGNSVFQQLYTPYVKSSVSLQKGWYCFDIDMSAYNPEVTSPFRADDKMSINCMTSSNASITLAGAIDGTSSGTIDHLFSSSTSSGKGKSIIDILKPEFGNVKATIESVKKGDYWGAAFKGAMSIYNIVKSVSASDNEDAADETQEPPTIELSHTGKLSLNGYMTSNTSNDAIGATFSYSAFAESDSIGAGVWSLRKNPVIYVVKDVLLGDAKELTAVVGENGYLLGPKDPAEYNLRLLTFLDPSSLRANINTKAFNKIENVKMSYTYGVYPNQPFGHTDPYRKNLLEFHTKGLLEEPVFINKSENLNKVYKSFSSTFANMRYVCSPLKENAYPTAYDNAPARFYSQNGAKFKYYGNAGNTLDSNDMNFFIVDPIVLLPYEYKKKKPEDSYGEGIFYDFVAPDFVVGVMLTFDYTAPDGTKKTACFSKRFIPTIVGITSAQARKALEEIENDLEFGDYWDGYQTQWPNCIDFMHRTYGAIYALPKQ